MSKGGPVKISGFGRFEVNQESAHQGRNPHTGETITIAPRRVLTFKPSELLRSSINGRTVGA